MSSTYYLELVDELEAYKMRLSRIVSMIVLKSTEYSVDSIEEDKNKISLTLKSAERNGHITEEEYELLKMQKKTIEMNFISDVESLIKN